MGASRAKPFSRNENGERHPVPVTDSATFTTPENEDEDLGEDLGGLDDLLASVTRSRLHVRSRGTIINQIL